MKISPLWFSDRCIPLGPQATHIMHNNSLCYIMPYSRIPSKPVSYLTSTQASTVATDSLISNKLNTENAMHDGKSVQTTLLKYENYITLAPPPPPPHHTHKTQKSPLSPYQKKTPTNFHLSLLFLFFQSFKLKI